MWLSLVWRGQGLTYTSSAMWCVHQGLPLILSVYTILKDTPLTVSPSPHLGISKLPKGRGRKDQSHLLGELALWESGHKGIRHRKDP